MRVSTVAAVAVQRGLSPVVRWFDGSTIWLDGPERGCLGVLDPARVLVETLVVGAADGACVGAGRALNAWGNLGRFSFDGDGSVGVRVRLGRGVSFVVPAALFAEMMAHFGGRVVALGLSRRPSRDSLGAWLRKRLPDVEVPSAFVGPVLVALGVASREGDTLRFGPAS